VDSRRHTGWSKRGAEEPDAFSGLQEISRIGEIAEEEVWVYLSDIPAQNMAEYGRVLPVPGAENAWFATLSAALRERLGPLA
jgi:hypothetical protein